MVSLLHPPTIVKELGIVGLSFSLLMSVQQMPKLFKHLSEGLVMKEKASKISV